MGFCTSLTAGKIRSGEVLMTQFFACARVGSNANINNKHGVRAAGGDNRWKYGSIYGRPVKAAAGVSKHSVTIFGGVASSFLLHTHTSDNDGDESART